MKSEKNKVLFLAAVDTAKDFDKDKGTRRILTDRAAAWNATFGLHQHVNNVWCGDDYSAMFVFSHTFGLLGRDMKIIHQLGSGEAEANPRRALGQIMDRTDGDLIIATTHLDRALGLVVPGLQPFESCLLYIVITDGKQVKVIPTESRKPPHPTMMSAEQFQATVEEARAGTLVTS